MFTVYKLINPKGKYYIGQSNDFDDRLRMHNDISPEKAKFHRTTYKKGPWKLVFKKDFKNRKESLEFEKFLKTGAGREWLERARLGG